jgi:2-keto-myo-inositol isomerase
MSAAAAARPRHRPGATEVSHLLSFALNHMVAPRRSFVELVEPARMLGLDQVEIRNDLDGVALRDGTPPERIRDEAAAGPVRILAINALQRFNDWGPTRASEARALARYAQTCGAAALVLCPATDNGYRRPASERQEQLRAALTGLAPILAEAGIIGLIEPLGFAESSLRLKGDAVEAIEDVGEGERFRLVHDTFHHYLAGEVRMFPDWTGIVHVSGVDDASLPLDRLRDEHRVLVGPDDILGNIAQIVALTEGYSGAYSFEAFAASVHASRDIAGALEASMHLIDRELAKLPV